MLVSEKWLREWVDPPYSLQEIADSLTQAGLEVEKIILSSKQDISSIIVAQILEIKAHPNADRLKLCKVSNGSKEYSVVCGAPNVRKGINVALALSNSELPGGIKIKKSKIRGELSEGMLCSERELGLSDEHKGIMEITSQAQLGSSVENYICMTDTRLDISITPNRGDCLSMIGIAREVSALYSLPIKLPYNQPVKGQAKDILPIELLSPQDCPRYLGRIIKGIDLSIPTPDWMQQKLHDSGLKPINIAVDVTNYVMQELGQPLHAFDLRSIKGGIRVRHAKDGEKLILLDGTVINLAKNDLLIADHKKPLALAGVMGGKNSAIADDTKDLFLEGAFFTPEAVFGKQQKYNLMTEAAYRYERGVDPELAHIAMERATQLLVETTGGIVCVINEAVSKKHLPQIQEIELNQDKACKFLGFSIKKEQVEKILTSLGMEMTLHKEDKIKEIKDEEIGHKNAVWEVRIPSYRSDIDCVEALYEELARIYGYDKIPITIPRGTLKPHLTYEDTIREDQIRDFLAARGFNEIISYSFVSSKEVINLYPDIKTLSLANPISSDMSVMRPSLLPGLLNTLVYNRRHNAGIIATQKIFEIGLCFVPSDNKEVKLPTYKQHPYIGMAILQPQNSSYEKAASYDMSFLVEDIRAFISLWGASQKISIAYPWTQKGKSKTSCLQNTFIMDNPNLHPRQFASLIKSSSNESDKQIGVCGLLHPRIGAMYKLGNANIYYFMALLKPFGIRNTGKYVNFSRHPYAHYELALVMDEEISYDLVQKYIRTFLDDKLQKIELLDIYTSAQLGEGKKSLALRLIWQADNTTLTDEYINIQVDKLLQQLHTKHKIHIRK